LDQLLSLIIQGAAAAAGKQTAGTPAAPLNQQQLQALWSELVTLLFAVPHNTSASAVGHQQQAELQQQQQPQVRDITLGLHDVIPSVDDIIQGEDDSTSSEDSWDEADEGWEEVQQQDEPQQQQDARQQQLPGRLLAVAVDPLYVVSAKSCRAAAQAAFRAYLQVRLATSLLASLMPLHYPGLQPVQYTLAYFGDSLGCLGGSPWVIYLALCRRLFPDEQCHWCCGEHAHV